MNNQENCITEEMNKKSWWYNCHGCVDTHVNYDSNKHLTNCCSNCSRCAFSTCGSHDDMYSIEKRRMTVGN